MAILITYIEHQSSNGNSKKFTISAWIKRAEPAGQHWILTVDSYPSGNMFQYQLDTGSYLGVQQYHGSSAQAYLITINDVLTDPGAWYHIVLKLDTTQSTAADRMRLYINGTEPNYLLQHILLKILNFKLIMLQNNLYWW